MKESKKQKDTYYQRHKEDPAFKEHRNAWARAYREKIREYQREYQKAYFKAHREELNAKRRQYADTTRNERVNRFKQKERERLGKNYIISLLTRSGKIRKEDVTPYMIAKRRRQILQKRAARAL
jgi:hypothetical protein